MSNHEFYAEPTIFDRWRGQAGSWFSARHKRMQPYMWSFGFLSFSLIFSFTAMTTLSRLGYLLVAADAAALPWDQLLAHGAALLIAVAMAYRLLSSARHARPEQAHHAHVVAKTKVSCNRAAQRHAATRRALRRKQLRGQDFLHALQEAGVSVKIARSLYSAGVRSAAQAQSVSDAGLLSICGVGPSTVAKLRTCFGVTTWSSDQMHAVHDPDQLQVVATR